LFNFERSGYINRVGELMERLTDLPKMESSRGSLADGKNNRFFQKTHRYRHIQQTLHIHIHKRTHIHTYAGIIPADKLLSMDDVSFSTPFGTPVATHLSFKLNEGGKNE
jgi:hypothetical protein